MRLWSGILVVSLGACGLTDREPPSLAFTGPTELAGEGSWEVQAEDTGSGVGRVTVSVDGGPPRAVEEGRFVLDSRALVDGPHSLEIVAEDRSVWANARHQLVELTVDNRPPILETTTTPASQGHTLAVWVRADEALVEPTVRLGERTVPLVPVDDAWRALLGLPIRQPTGPTELVLDAGDPLGNTVEERLTVEVAPVDWPRGGTIRLTKRQTAARQDHEARARTRAEREAAYAHEEPEQLWAGPMIQPIQARMSSGFGRFREYSTGERWHHDAVDLTTRRGAPLVASGDGVVVLAHEQAIFGNAVIIAHGHGVLTSYGHLDRIDVEEGQRVARGDRIGLLGNTGQSTGPHVHWGLVVAGEAVDPMQWTEEDFSTWPE